MDDPNITMEEYIRLEEEKTQRHGQTFNWQTAMFGKVENYEDEDDCSIDFETEFPAIVFDNTLTTIPSEPTVYLEVKPHVISERIDEFNLIDEASLSEYDEEIVLRFNDLFNIIHPDDSKLEKHNGGNNIDIIQSSEGSFVMNLKFGIPFDPKLYYKDGSHTKVAEAKEQYGDLAETMICVYCLDFLYKRYRGTPKLVEDDEEDEDEEIEESLDSDSVSEDAEDEGPTAEDEDPVAGDEGLIAGDERPSMGVKSCSLDDESHGLDDEGHSVECDGFGLGEEEKAVPEG
ncbi:hypothetical protein Tco_1200486 [Tanacetum coccineum]